MKKKKLIFILLIIFVVLKFNKLGYFQNVLTMVADAGNYSQELSLGENYREIEDISSKAAISVDLKDNKIILGKNIDQRIQPASMTKVMTAIIAIENSKDLNSKVKITNDMISYCVNNDLSMSGFEEGDSPKKIDLLYGLMLESGGEASLALQEDTCDTKEEFVELMNEKARQLGMKNTHFSNSIGQTSEDNYSTVEDIAKLFEYALKDKTFKKIISTKTYEAKHLNGLSKKNQINNLLFQKRAVLDINKEYILGGKTGYTQAAGLCLVSYGKIENREFVTVTAGASGDSSTVQNNLVDTNKICQTIEEMYQ